MRLTTLQITLLEAALSHEHSKTATSTHPLLGPEYIDGGFASLSPRHNLPTLTHSSTSPDSKSASLQLETPSISALDPRSASHPRMAVESLLLSEDVAMPEERKDAEWVSENAAPAMIVGPLLTALHGYCLTLV